MREIDFLPIGRRTSRIGLGCARLAGRDSLRESSRMVEAALALGIRYFDVAPSYGLGTAEEVLGAVIGANREVVVATKVGVPRPAYSSGSNRIRQLSKRILDRIRPLKAAALGSMRMLAKGHERPRYDFSGGALRVSLEQSLERLRRDSVDIFLAHEPHRDDLREEVAAGFQDLQSKGLITAFGVGVGAVSAPWARFGPIWQSCWPGDGARNYPPEVTYVWHGAIRTSRSATPEQVVREVLEASPTSILLVSASTPRRLSELVAEIDF